jgi:hypothetical protein
LFVSGKKDSFGHDLEEIEYSLYQG